MRTPGWLAPSCAAVALSAAVIAASLTVRQYRTGGAVPAPVVTETRWVTADRYPDCPSNLFSGLPPQSMHDQRLAIDAERAGGCIWRP